MKTPVNDVRNYWSKVFRRSFRDAFSFAGTNPRKSLITGGCTFLGAIALGFIQGWEKAGDKILWYVLCVSAFWMVFFLIVFLAFVIRTPYVIHLESAEQLRITQSEAEQKTEALKAVVQTKDEEVKSVRSEMQSIATSDPGKNIKRAALNKFIDRLNDALVRLEGVQKNALNNFYSLDSDIRNYLGKNFSEYTEYARKYPRVESYTSKAVYTADDMKLPILMCKDRIESVREVLGHLG